VEAEVGRVLAAMREAGIPFRDLKTPAKAPEKAKSVSFAEDAAATRVQASVRGQQSRKALAENSVETSAEAEAEEETEEDLFAGAMAAQMAAEAEAARPKLPAVLVYGAAHDSMSRKLASRCGGTLLDLEALAGMAAEAAEGAAGAEGAAAGAALAGLAAMQSGGLLPSFSSLLPLLQRAVAEQPPPYILNGFPRMASQLKLLGEAAGPLSMAVCAGEASAAADAKLHERLRATGVHVYEARAATMGSALELERVLTAMKEEGIGFEAVSEASAAASPTDGAPPKLLFQASIQRGADNKFSVKINKQRPSSPGESTVKAAIEKSPDGNYKVRIGSSR